METSSNKLDEIKIAGILTITDWGKCKKDLTSDKNENWGAAFNFFEQRITTRYLKPIHRILDMNSSTGEGFAVVNLQCSLIETIECFYNGWIYKYDKGKKPRHRYYFQKVDEAYFRRHINGSSIFKNFFKKQEPFTKVNIPDSFYSNVRCALLHETQTKNGWVIRDRHYDKFYEIDGNKKIIYRTNFQTALEKVIADYKKIIVEGGKDCKNLRENFIAKFDHICTESKAK